MKHAALLALLLLTTAVLVGCRTKGKATIEYDRPLPPGQLALRKITDPNELPDFTRAWRDLDSLEAAVQNSLSYLAKPSSEQYFPYGDVNHDRVVKSLETFLTLVESGILSTEINGLIRAYFDVYESVGCDNRGTVLFTGYYTPIFDGALERTGRFRYPLYKMPADLVKGPDGQTLGRRGADGRITPYPTRATIEDSGMLAGTELSGSPTPSRSTSPTCRARPRFACPTATSSPWATPPAADTTTRASPRCSSTTRRFPATG